MYKRILRKDFKLISYSTKWLFMSKGRSWWRETKIWPCIYFLLHFLQISTKLTLCTPSANRTLYSWITSAGYSKKKYYRQYRFFFQKYLVLKHFKLFIHKSRKSWGGISFSSVSRPISPLPKSSVLHHIHSENSRRENQTENHVVLLSLLSYSTLDPRNQEAIKSFCFNSPSCSNSCSRFVCLKLCSFKSLSVHVSVHALTDICMTLFFLSSDIIKCLSISNKVQPSL